MKAKTLFPYPTLFGDLNLSISEVYIDDQPIRDCVNFDDRVLDLSLLDRAQWEDARFTVNVSGPPSEIAELSDSVCIAVLNCGPSNTRLSCSLSYDPTNKGQWVGEFRINRHYWYGQSKLRCHVAAEVENVRNRIIGTSDDWTVLFDDLPNKPIVNGSIKISWADFENPGDDKKYLKEHADDYVYLRLDPHEPQLFLNKSFDGLPQLFEPRRRQKLDRALHDQTRAGIAEKTWTALFNAALNSVEQDDETGELEWPMVDWQRGVLEILLHRMYPEISFDEALKAAWESSTTPELAGTLQELLAPAVAAEAKAAKLLRGGIRLVTSEDLAELDGTDAA